jgi:hypothetical protein
MSAEAVGARMPTQVTTVWAAGMPPRPVRSGYAGTAGLLLVVEVVSRGSEVVDRVVKTAEYAHGRHSPLLGRRA